MILEDLVPKDHLSHHHIEILNSRTEIESFQLNSDVEDAVGKSQSGWN